MSNVNGSYLVGNIARAPRYFAASNGRSSLLSFPVAVNGYRNGESQLDGYFDVSVYGQLADNCRGSLGVGQRVVLTGEWRQYAPREEGGQYTVRFHAGDLGVSQLFAHRAAVQADPTPPEEQAEAVAAPQRDSKGRFVSSENVPF